MECIEILHVAWKTLEFFLQNSCKILQKLAKGNQKNVHGKFSKNYVKYYKKCLATCKILQIV